MYIRRKNRLIKIIHCYCRICPPKKSLRKWRWIIKTTFNFKNCLTRMQGKTCHPFLVKHFFILTYPNRYTSISIVFNGIINRQKCTGPMVLWPVKLNTSRNPGTCKSYQSRFYDLIVINKMTLFDFIVRHLYPAS